MSSLLHRVKLGHPPYVCRQVSSLLALSAHPDRAQPAVLAVTQPTPPESYGPLLAAALLAQTTAHKQPTLRSTSGIDPPPSPQQDKDSSEHDISDQEWEIRTGRSPRARRMCT